MGVGRRGRGCDVEVEVYVYDVQVLFMECALWTRRQPSPQGRSCKGELAYTHVLWLPWRP